MDKRKILSRAIATMFALLALGFIYVLFSGLSSQNNSSVINSKAITDINLPKSPMFDIELGRSEIRRHQGQRLWVTQLAPQQLTELATLEDWLVDVNSGCSTQQVWCAVRTKTQQSGIELRYVKNRPPQLESLSVWVGGFVDPTNGAVYDLLGRAYKQNKASNSQAINVSL